MKQRAAVGKAFRDSLPEHGRSERLELLGTLFPSRAKAIQGRDVWGGEAWHQQVSRRGVGTAADYDAYFSMLPAEDAVPKAWIDETVTILGDRKQLVESLDRALEARTLAGRRLVGPFLEQLHYRFLGPRAATPTETLLGALFDRGETILSLERDGDILGPRSQMTFLIHEMLRQWGSRTTLRGEVEQGSEGTSVATAAHTKRSPLCVLPCSRHPACPAIARSSQALKPTARPLRGRRTPGSAWPRSKQRRSGGPKWQP